MPTAETIFLLVICHAIGDYVLQGDFIAKSKGENWYHLFIHCVLYIVPFYIAFGFDGWFLSYLFVTHFIIDAAKARYNAISYVRDQVYHYAALLMALKFLYVF